jgi:prolipoprotein diacylglyceryltransferase
VKSNPEKRPVEGPKEGEGLTDKERRLKRNLWTGLILLAFLSPLGLLLPRLFNADEAWGEWAPEKLMKLLGYIPERLYRTANIWKAPLPDYSPVPDHPSFLFQAAWYVVSALLGVALILALVSLLKRYLAKHGS